MEASAQHGGGAMSFELQLLEPRDGSEPIGGRIAGELDLDAVCPHPGELGKRRDGDELPRPDDPDAITDVLHLAENMRRHEHGCSRGARISHQPVENLLMQRIESTCRLIEDEQFRSVHEREDKRELLFVSVRVLAVFPAEIERQPGRELGDVSFVDVPPKSDDVADDLRPTPATELGKLSGDVTDLLLDGHRIAIGVQPEDRRPTAGRVDHPHQQLDRRRLSGSVGPEIAKDLSRPDGELEIENAATQPVVLGQRPGLDRGRGPFAHRIHSPLGPVNDVSMDTDCGSMAPHYVGVSVTLADVERAQRIVSPLLHRTPLFSSRALAERIGASTYLKAENLQRTGSFKPRGAVYAVSRLSKEQRDRGIVTMSAGNAAQAIAFAAASAGVPVTVAMPESAPKTKVEATRGYGADVVFAPDITKLTALVGEIKERTGAYFLHPYDDAAMIAGHGTCALEILEDLPDADLLVVGVGGGGLIAGIAVAVAAKRPTARVVGVVAAVFAGAIPRAVVLTLVAAVVLVAGDVSAEGMREPTAPARSPAGALTAPAINAPVFGQ